MTITVDIRPEVQAELARQAAAHGRALEAHAATLLEDAAHVPVQRTPQGTLRETIDTSAGGPGLLIDEESRAAQAANLMELFEPIRGLLTDDEVDTLFRRNPSAGRPVDFA
jgi:hypothetical protein